MHISKAEIRFLRSLSQRKVREEEKKFVLEGWRALKDALNSGWRIGYVAVTPRYLEDPDYQPIVREIAQHNIVLKELSEAELRQVSDTVHAQGVVALVHQQSPTVADLDRKDASLVVVADRIADPGNVGSMVRTCDWFGVDALILTEGSVDLYNEKVVRSTAGSIFHTPIVDLVSVEETLGILKKLGFTIVGTAADAKTPYAKVRYPHKTALVLGSEANGLSLETRRLCDETVRIERRGKAESLNVGVACGIILSHIRNGQ